MCMTERGSCVFVFEPEPTRAPATTGLTAGAMKPLSDRVAAWPPRNYIIGNIFRENYCLEKTIATSL